MSAPVAPAGPCDDSPGKALLDLYRSGQLAREYPRVRQLVAALSGPDLIRSGHLLARLDPEEVIRAHPAVPAVTVALTGHGTLATLVPALTAEFARHGLLPRFHVSGFDSYVFDLGDPGSALYAADPDLTLCVLDAAVVFDELPVPWRLPDAERTVWEKVHLLERLAARFTATSRGSLVLNTMPLLERFAGQLIDHRSRAGLGAVWREAGARLLRLPEQYPALVVLDLDPFIAEGPAASDARLSVYAKAHLSPDLLARYAREVGHLARHLTGRTKKCLVLDLDNTVWNGVLAEDGMDGVEIAGSYRGEAFHAFQRVIRQVGSQGVLVAAVSKNDPGPVRELIRDHPDMVLREDDFVRIAANWQPKHDNLTELAEALSLGTDSFVFVDDSAYECGLVRRELPGVAVVQLDDEPARHVEKLLRDGWFTVRELTVEDRGRASAYQADLIRADFLDSFDSIKDYLRELRLTMRLAPVQEPDVPRISQLTLRTNQFNMTALRLQPPELRVMIADPRTLVLAISASDRFGDNGVVGAVFTHRDGDVIHIDNFVLSCRVFSRGLEKAGLAAVLEHARASGTEAVLGAYRPTARNGIMRDFYSRYGFEQISDDGAAVTFRHNLTEIIAPPEHICLATSLGGDRS